MEEKKQETGLKLSKEQLESVITEHLSLDEGLNDVFNMVLNGLMYSERKTFLESENGMGNKGNGYRQAKRSGLGSRLSLSIPRDRLGAFKPVILGLLDQQEEQVKDLCFELYGKGLTTRQIEPIIERIYGSSYSKSSISRITTDFSSLVEAWLERPLDRSYPLVFIDAIHIKIRRDTVATEAFYVVLGLKEDLTREVLGIINIPQESAQGWEEVLGNIKARGVEKVGLFVFDGLTGLKTAVAKVFAQSMQQECILHFQRNINKHIRKTDRKAFSEDLSAVFDPDNQNHTIEKAIIMLTGVLSKWLPKFQN